METPGPYYSIISYSNFQRPRLVRSGIQCDNYWECLACEIILESAGLDFFESLNLSHFMSFT